MTYEYEKTETAVAQDLITRGIPAEVWQTGGGCLAVVATIPESETDVVWTSDGIVGIYTHDPDHDWDEAAHLVSCPHEDPEGIADAFAENYELAKTLA